MRLHWTFAVLTLAGGAAAAKPCPAVPANFTLNPPQPRGSRELPDPFLSVQGHRIAKRSEWACRRSEIAQLAEEHEFGPIPRAPDFLNASVVNNRQLVVTITDNNRTITFTAKITYPTTGNAPYPVLIAIAGANIPIPAGIATVTLPIDTLIQPGDTFTNGHRGLFFNLFGGSHPAGISAVAIWATARLIDAIELTAPSSSLDATRLAATGCSRNARTALAVGAFEERIALTIAQEAGQGGDSCYRLRDDDKQRIDICNTLQCERYPDQGQTAGFRRFWDNPASLPFDRHSVVAMIAPRALLVLQNNVQWLQPRSGWLCMGTAKKVFEALGVGDRMAVSMGLHDHCRFPEGQGTLLDAYVRKFLFGEEGVELDTDVVELRTELDGLRQAYSWTVPKLE